MKKKKIVFFFFTVGAPLLSEKNTTTTTTKKKGGITKRENVCFLSTLCLCFFALSFCLILFFFHVHFDVCFVGPLHAGPRRILFPSPVIKTIYGNGAVSCAKKKYIHVFRTVLVQKGLYQHNCSSSFIDTFLASFFFFILCSLYFRTGRKKKKSFSFLEE